MLIIGPCVWKLVCKVCENVFNYYNLPFPRHAFIDPICWSRHNTDLNGSKCHYFIKIVATLMFPAKVVKAQSQGLSLTLKPVCTTTPRDSRTGLIVPLPRVKIWCYLVLPRATWRYLAETSRWDSARGFRVTLKCKKTPPWWHRVL